MNNALVRCTHCNVSLLENVFNLQDLVPCPVCGKLLQVEIFPAMFRSREKGRESEAILESSESSCFYHPEKKALVPCDSCGRFLCALCDCELSGRHLCPTCIETGSSKGKIQNLENHRTLYDSLALTLAILPALTCFGACFTIFTSPAAIFLAIRHWNTPTSVVRNTKVRHVFAIILASITLAGWFAYFFILFYYAPRHTHSITPHH